MGREGEVPAREALVEEREERFAALTEHTHADRINVADYLGVSRLSVVVGRMWKRRHLTRLMMTASAPAALKQLSVCVFVGGYRASERDGAESGLGEIDHSVPSGRSGFHCSCSSGSSSDGNEVS